MSQASYRTFLRATSILGVASFINIITGLIKIKIAALFLGPAGVGLIGLYQNIILTGSAIGGLGMSSSGTRRIASAAIEGDPSIALARRALFLGALIQAAVSALLFWVSAGFIAQHFIDDPARVSEVKWLSLGIALMVGVGAQTAVLSGLRLTADIASVTIWNGIIGAVGSFVVLWWLGSQALLAVVLITPLATFLLGQIYVQKIAAPKHHASRALIAREWSLMARMGIAVMVSGFVNLSGGLAVRVLVQRELGVDALGQFQAAWMIGMTYLTFALSAMSTDFFPRLTAVINDKSLATELVNQQTEFALLLCGPVIILMIGCAPLMIQLLYTSEFGPAVEILRWQLIGDILKVISWPLGFILLASEAGKRFVLAEALGIGVFVVTVALTLPAWGVTATGLGFVMLYTSYLPVVWWLGRGIIDFSWSKTVLLQATVTMAAVVLVALIGEASASAGVAAGFTLGSLMAVWSMTRIASISGGLADTGSVAGRLKTKIRAWLGRPDL